MALEAERALGQAELARIEAAAAAEFDARDAKAIEAMAREIYAADAAKYSKGPEVSASHILVDTKKRDGAAALTLARRDPGRLLAGEDFAAVAKAALRRPFGQDERWCASVTSAPNRWIRRSRRPPSLCRRRAS